MRLGMSSLAVAAAALCLAGVTSASGAATFADPAGDAQSQAPDVTDVTVSNDDRGLITFRVTVSNRSALGPDDVVAIPFATNTPGRAGVRDDGVGFVIGLDGANGPFLLRWNGADMIEPRPRPRSVSGSFAGGVATISVRQDDLAPGFPARALPTKVVFYVLGILFGGSDVVAEDEAPNGSDEAWSYDVVQPRRLVVSYFRTSATVKAGATLTAELGGAWSDDGRAAKPSRLSCRAVVGGRALKVTVRGSACTWAVPANARGKIVSGRVTVTNGSFSVTRSFTARVR
ncbi:MAG: hypothetical protein ACJ74A_10610 [Gaiellaceae bacterium]